MNYIKKLERILTPSQEIEDQIGELLGIDVKYLRIPNKKWRSEVIADYVRNELKTNKIIIFSCGNAADALEEQGLDVLSGGPKGRCDFVPDKWYTPEEIAQKWPDRFDATSGHLSELLMQRIAARFKKGIGRIEEDNIVIPTGSGETIYCLKLAYPDKKFIALYSENDPATKYEDDNPFNQRVQDVAIRLINTDRGITKI
ncbi:MAG: hypothetical protein ACOC3C_04765 [Candidatus Thorarchaeota archaeon]